MAPKGDRGTMKNYVVTITVKGEGISNIDVLAKNPDEARKELAVMLRGVKYAVEQVRSGAPFETDDPECQE